ncbi:MAG: sulfite exporter TauE/SafE family protein, partial [Lachnospiraceae bacterium]|nr:sulfite exporter TauE/SafE family protein [Lachnospiraceae bacterium]
SSVTYGMLFLTGLLTSVHCVGLCGAISLSVTSSGKAEKSLQQPILYNLGRILSYTVIGGMVGALGSVFRINDSLSGVVILAAAIFMFLLALRMLGIFSWQLRRRDAASGKLFFRGRAARIKGRSLRVLSIGLLNGLMPCGPLQAMQIYALSTGSAWRGALVMFLFALGTVPLMLFVGALSSFLHGKGRFMVNKLSAALVLVLAVGMAGRGLSMLGIHPESLLAHMRHPESNEVSEGYAGYQVATLQDGYQELRFELSFSGYADVLVLAEVPVRMHIHVEEGTLTGCNEEVMSRDFGFAQKLKVGDNLIEFTPVQSGDYTYTCWMNMLRNQIKVVEDASILER